MMATVGRSRLLVIDDEPRMGRMLVRLLRERYDVTAATAADEALELVVHRGFDVILCDVMLPGTSGIAFLEQLERVRPEAARSLGFMTAGAFDAEVRAFLAGRGDRWLAKPFDRASALGFLARVEARASKGEGVRHASSGEPE